MVLANFRLDFSREVRNENSPRSSFHPSGAGVRVAGHGRSGGRHRPRHSRHEDAVGTGGLRDEDRLHLRRRPLDRRSAGRQPATPDRRRRTRVEPCVFARREVDRLLRSVRGEHRRLRRLGRGRRPATPDLASGRRCGAGIHFRRKEDPFCVAALRLHGPLHAALHRPGGGRPRGGSSDSSRRPCVVFARREEDRLQPDLSAVSSVEALPRGSGLAGMDLRRRHPCDRESPATGGTRQRRRSGVDGRRGLLPLGSRRRVEPLCLRHEIQGGPAPDAPRGFSGDECFRRRRPRRLRAGGIPPPARSR